MKNNAASAAAAVTAAPVSAPARASGPATPALKPRAPHQLRAAATASVPRLSHDLSRTLADFSIYALVYISAVFIVLLLVGIIAYVCAKGWLALNLEFFTCSTSLRKGTIGVAGNIINTLIIVVVTLAIAIPIGVGSAIYLQEYAQNKRLVHVIDLSLIHI